MLESMDALDLLWERRQSNNQSKQRNKKEIFADLRPLQLLVNELGLTCISQNRVHLSCTFSIDYCSHNVTSDAYNHATRSEPTPLVRLYGGVQNKLQLPAVFE